MDARQHPHPNPLPQAGEGATAGDGPFAAYLEERVGVNGRFARDSL
jgi:hypothetical protein